MKIKLIKYKENYKYPNRAHFDDAGADIYMLTDGKIQPNETLVIPVGFGLDLPNGTICSE